MSGTKSARDVSRYIGKAGLVFLVVCIARSGQLLGAVEEVTSSEDLFAHEKQRLRETAISAKPDLRTLLELRKVMDTLRWPTEDFIKANRQTSPRIEDLRTKAADDIEWLLKRGLVPPDIKQRLIPVKGVIQGVYAHHGLEKRIFGAPRPKSPTVTSTHDLAGVAPEEVFTFIPPEENNPQSGYDAFLVRYRVSPYTLQTYVTEAEIIIDVKSDLWDDKEQTDLPKSLSRLKEILSSEIDTDKLALKSEWFGSAPTVPVDGNIIQRSVFVSPGSPSYGKQIRWWFNGRALQIVVDRFEYPWLSEGGAKSPPGSHLRPADWFKRTKTSSD